MAEKILNTRIIHKHDTEENWLKAENFIPKQGEIIVYDIDDGYSYERFKIGDGVTNVNTLPFNGEWNRNVQSDWNENDETSDAYILNKPEIVTSINGSTGDVTLTASDVGALPLEDYYGPTAFEENIVSFNSLEGLGINATSIIKPAQGGSGVPTPSNIRPISGWEGATLRLTGKNLLPYPYYEGSATKAGITFTVNGDGTVNANGTATGNAVLNLGYIRYPAGTYRLTGGKSVNARLVANKYINGADISGALDGGAGATLTLTESTVIHFYIVIISGTEVSDLLFSPQFEAGTTATAYSSPQSAKYEAAFGQVVYGGELDWNTGRLTVNYRLLTLTGNETWGMNKTSVFHFAMDVVHATSLLSTDPFTGVCSHYKNGLTYTQVWFTSEPAAAVAGSGIPYVRIHDGRYTALADFKAYLAAQYAAGTPVQIAYPLATGTQIQLSHQTILSLAGENNLWSNCGPTKGIYNLTPIEVTERELIDTINNIEIGGRNLLADSEGIRTVTAPNTAYELQVREILSPYIDKEICVSFDIISNSGNPVKVYAYQNSGISINIPDYSNLSFTPSTTEYTRFSFATTVKDYGLIENRSTGSILFYDSTTLGFSIKRIKIELGNKPTDWTPASEDVNEAIEVASQTVKSTVVAPSSMTKYYLLSSDNPAEEIDSARKTPNITINVKAGTTSSPGIAQLILGNNSAAGTAGNSTGYITLYSDGGGSHKIYPSSSTSDLTHTLPGVGGGTLISTKNYTSIPSATTSSAGLMSAADKQKLEELVSGGDNGESTITYVTAGNGLTGGGASGNVTLNVGAGSGIQVAADSISVNTSYTTSGKNYKVQVDGTSGGLFVNVPWTDNNTTYSAGTGISLSGTTFSNSGVRSVSTGSTNGTISVNTNGSTANIAVKGLGSAAYKDASGTWDISINGLAYQALLDGEGNTISSTYLSLAGGALTGRTYNSSTIAVDAGASFRNINIVEPTTTIEAGVTAIPTGEIWIKYE